MLRTRQIFLIIHPVKCVNLSADYTTGRSLPAPSFYMLVHQQRFVRCHCPGPSGRVSGSIVIFCKWSIIAGMKVSKAIMDIKQTMTFTMWCFLPLLPGLPLIISAAIPANCAYLLNFEGIMGILAK